MDKTKTTELDNVVVRFSGDSGDGMQLTGTLFSNLSAILGNEISTFPDFPSEIRAPLGTIGGVSGFQVHLGSSKIYTPGDDADVLVAMNPAALKVNAASVKKGGIIIFDTDSFEKSDLDKAGFKTDNPFVELGISDATQLIPAALSSLTQSSLDGFGPSHSKTATACLLAGRSGEVGSIGGILQPGKASLAATSIGSIWSSNSRPGCAASAAPYRASARSETARNAATPSTASSGSP